MCPRWGDSSGCTALLGTHRPRPRLGLRPLGRGDGAQLRRHRQPTRSARGRTATVVPVPMHGVGPHGLLSPRAETPLVERHHRCRDRL